MFRRLCTASLPAAGILVIVVLLSLPLAAFAAPQPPSTVRTYVVKRGDTLADIAWTFGVPAGALGRANGINNFNHIYPGQVLVIPGRGAEQTVVEKPAARQEPAAAAPAAAAPAAAEGAAARQTAAAPASAATETAPAPAADEDVSGTPKAARDDQDATDDQWACLEPPPVDDDVAEEVGDKWIDVDLSEQRLAACEGKTIMLNVLVSTGTDQYPTPIGSFSILDRVRFETMDGPDYYLEDVPNVLLFKRRGYAIHGTYWHENFGHPMSHGCINLTIEDSAWVYDWAPNGTPVIVHE